MKSFLLLLAVLILSACGKSSNPDVALDNPDVVPGPGTMYAYTLELPPVAHVIALHLMPVGPSAPGSTPISVVNFTTDPAVNVYTVTSVYINFMLSNVSGGPLDYTFTKVNTLTGEIVLNRAGTLPVGEGLYWFDY